MSVLEAHNIVKVFPGTIALNGVNVSFKSGEVHALVGKNGSGKTTLVKIFSGAFRPTKGEILFDGKPLNFNSPKDAFDKGIATVYQELSLIPGLTVAENIFVGRLPMKKTILGEIVDWDKTYRMAKELLDELRVNIPPKEVLYRLSMWQWEIVEIAKAMSFNPKVIMLDEPTSSLAYHETHALFDIIRELKKKDVVIIYITHRLHELWEIADTCTVLRDGNVVDTVSMKDVNPKDIVKMMFGEVEIRTRPKELKYSDEVVLEIKGLSRRHQFEDISFKLRKGEILGIAGMLGSGRTELLKAIFGVNPIDRGEIIVSGKKVEKLDPIEMKHLGIVMTPEDRKREGLIQIHSVKNNLCLASLELLGKGSFVDRNLEDEFARREIRELDIKVSNYLLPISSLSGGNQQKVVVGKWLNTSPRVILFDEPTRGIDVSAKQQIFEIIWEQSRNGIASIIVSSELEELIEVCHRILIMRHGKIIGEVLPEEITIEELYSMCMGGEDIENNRV
jgi:ribose transport system ATP-binding protein